MKKTMERHRGRRRGSTLVETMLVIIMITILFWCFFLAFDLAMMKIITNHSAFLMGRSHIVGFNHGITERARNVGLIPISGKFVTPAVLNEKNQVKIAGHEPALIEDYVQGFPALGSGDLLEYDLWDKDEGYVNSDTGEDSDGPETFSVTMMIPKSKSGAAGRHRFNIIPFLWAFTKEDSYSTSGSSKILNHASYYLKGSTE